MIIGIATYERTGWQQCVHSIVDTAFNKPGILVTKRMDFLKAYNDLYWRMIGKSDDRGIVGFVHDDVRFQEEGWDLRVEEQFRDPKVGLVGFGGAIRHGSNDMYRTPYDLPQLARGGFVSNLREAEVHGHRFVGDCNVAVLDGFTLFMRRNLLDAFGGWPKDGKIGYFMYSEWLCCMTRRMGLDIRLVGAACDHLGGKSTGLNKTAKFDFEGEHKEIYDMFPDVLPWEVQP